MTATPQLCADEAAVRQFTAAMFLHADEDTFISLRAFDDGQADARPLFAEGVRAGAPFLVDKVCIRIDQAARAPRAVVFCPPVATFRTASGAAQADLANGVALTVECDRTPQESLATLSAVLGAPTIVVASGGDWVDPQTGEIQEKLHLHWRLAEPTRTGEEHALLREARELACRLVGADATSISIVHPLRWPGSWHRKGEPHLARIVVETAHEIDLSVAVEALQAIVPPATEAQEARKTDKGIDRDRTAAALDIVSALAVLPNPDLTWDEWNRIGMAAWSASAGAAFAAFDAWSQLSAKYDAAATAARWRHYATSPPSRIGAGSLFHMANAVDPTWVRPSLQGAAPDFIELDTPERSSSSAERQGAGARPRITAQPFRWIDPTTIPMREWLYGRHYIRRFVSLTVSPGGVGKSSLAIAESLALTSGRDLLGVQPPSRVAVWYWNGEDPQEELDRRLMATALHYGLEPADFEGRLFVNSGRTTEIVVAEQLREGVKVARPVVDELKATILENGVDLVIIDPFVSSHQVTENDNMAIDRVAKTWGAIAEATGCAIELVHHVRKTNSGEVSVEDGRGAVALLAAARSARVLNVMSEDEAAVSNTPDRKRHFRVDNGKANLAPPAAASTWYRMASVDLGNGHLGAGDDVGVVTPWQYRIPDPLDGVNVAGLRAAQAAVANGRWRENIQAKDWVGIPIAQALGVELDRAGKQRISRLLQV